MAHSKGDCVRGRTDTDTENVCKLAGVIGTHASHASHTHTRITRSIHCASPLPYVCVPAAGISEGMRDKAAGGANGSRQNREPTALPARPGAVSPSQPFKTTLPSMHAYHVCVFVYVCLCVCVSVCCVCVCVVPTRSDKGAGAGAAACLPTA